MRNVSGKLTLGAQDTESRASGRLARQGVSVYADLLALTTLARSLSHGSDNFMEPRLFEAGKGEDAPGQQMRAGEAAVLECFCQS
jgi:hypothetical protein